LPKSDLQVLNVRGALKALDLDGDLLLASLGCQHSLCSEVNEDILLPEREDIRIVGDGPAVFDERLLDGFVIDVSGGHIPFYSKRRRSRKFRLGTTPQHRKQPASRRTPVRGHGVRQWSGWC